MSYTQFLELVSTIVALYPTFGNAEDAINWAWGIDGIITDAEVDEIRAFQKEHNVSFC